MGTAGSQSITATDSVTGSITGTQSVTVNAGAQAGIGLANITQQPNPNLTCSGAVGSITCTSSGEAGNGNASARTVTASIQLEDQYGNAVTNTSGSSITVNVASSGNVQSFVPSSGILTIPNNQSVSSGSFTLVRSSGTGKTATMTGMVGGTTEMTITLSS